MINAGKSQHNEDQACCEVVFVEQRHSPRGRLSSREGGGELDGVRAVVLHKQGHNREDAQQQGMRWDTVCTLGIPLVCGPSLCLLLPSSIPM